MTQLITWDGSGATLYATTGTQVIGSIDWTSSRKDIADGTPYILSLRLIGGRHESKHATTDAAKRWAEGVFDGHLRSFGYVPKSELAVLRERAGKLTRLEAAGVDNWEGYGNAMSEGCSDCGYSDMDCECPG